MGSRQQAEGTFLLGDPVQVDQRVNLVRIAEECRHGFWYDRRVPVPGDSDVRRPGVVHAGFEIYPDLRAEQRPRDREDRLELKQRMKSRILVEECPEVDAPAREAFLLGP